VTPWPQWDEVEKSVEPSGFTTPEEDTDALLARLCREGGVELQNLLILKAVSPTANEKTPKEWKYWDIATLPQAELEEWRTACNEELEALHRRKVYDLVERPRGRKVIKNRWVFNQKPDGRKKARLVAKGFSQVEGMDYDAVFSPVVRFETVCQEHGIFKLFITHSFHELFLPFLMFECFTFLIIHPPSFQQQKAQCIQGTDGTWH
jgi:hypothetical protein